MKHLACIVALTCCSLGAWAQEPAKPPVVALVAAVGDQIDIVRQRERTGTHREPFSRKSFTLNGRALNMAILKGLDQAIEEAEPQAQRVLLAWTAPAQTQQQLAEADGKEREAITLAALKQHLQSLPARAGWDRIEAILPSYFYSSVGGMGRKLSGLGFYVQPLDKGASVQPWDSDGEALDSETPDPDPAGGSSHRTVDPNTGETGRSLTYVATYMYFQRVTLDARTLEVVSRKRQLDNVKYADPKATALDVGDQIPLRVMTSKLLDLAERSAYTSVRGKSQINVTAPRPVEPGASAAR
ncbi:hypothetical protein ACG02S_23040 [Roseateles sp. DC23W]|uniref:Defect in organelle trafficking protein DotC n=1 Tax=Pelomonas dachongensis TaxID=3299029 RepID=A0ABW7ETW6_9BURK